MKMNLVIAMLMFVSCYKQPDVVCNAPTNLTVKNIGRNGATFVWDAQIPAPAMGYWWKISKMDGTQVIRNAGHDTYTLVGSKYEVYIYALQGEMQPNTQYKFEIASQCHYPDSVSTFTSLIFTTTN